MITGKDIVFISSIEWDFLWQHPQEIASQLARAGNRVLYVENTGIRAPGMKDAGRVARRLKSWFSALASRGVRQVQPNLYVCSPLVLPPFGSRWRRRLNRRLFLPLVCRAARKLGLRDPLLWTHLPTDTALELIKLLRTPRSLLLYYCIADFAQLTPSPHQLEQSEKALLETSDLVFANCGQLVDHCKRWRDTVHCFPPGLNMKKFPLEELLPEESEATATAISSTSLASGKSESRPIIGYIGGLHKFLDLELLSAAARQRPNWLWFFVGPVQTPLGDFARLPNVVLVGQQPHNKLVSYLRTFDVGIVPYLTTTETATVFPVKLNEYLAAGKPVVSTELPAVCDFNQRHNILLTAPSQPDRFLGAIEQALHGPNGMSEVARRRQVAGLSDWSERIESMCRLIEAELRAKAGLSDRCQETPQQEAAPAPVIAQTFRASAQ